MIAYLLPAIAVPVMEHSGTKAMSFIFIVASLR
jgi:hypothetical protein